jgi:DnaK suppressor protein
MKARKKTPKKISKKAAKKPTRKAVGKAPRRPGAKTRARRKPRKPAIATVRKGGAPTKRVGPAASRRPRVRARVVSPRVQKLKAMLETKGAEVLEKIKRARADSLEIDRTSFAEVGDLVSASVEKEKAFEYSEAGVNALREIATALEKLKEGTYGICERCGKPIGVKRLEAMPSARLCVKCKTKEEATGKIVPPSADDLFED